MTYLLSPLYSAVHTLFSVFSWALGAAVLVALVAGIFVVFPRIWPVANAVLLPVFTTVGTYLGKLLGWFLADLEGGLPNLVSSGKTIVALIAVMVLSALGGVQYEKSLEDGRKDVPNACQKVVKDFHAKYTLLKKGTRFKIIK